MSLHSYLATVFTLFGLVIGSFLNVVIYRLPAGMSTVYPDSRCPRCLMSIRPWHNVPVLGYLLLGGRCRDCRMVISPRYPAIEALTGALFWLAFVRFESLLESVVAALFCAAMLTLAMIDLDSYLLPDMVTLPGIAVGLALQPWLSWAPAPAAWGGAVLGATVGAVLGAVLGAALPLLLSFLWSFLERGEGMGLGDVKMLAMIGAFLGWQGALVVFFAALLLAAVVGLALYPFRAPREAGRLPLGFFLGGVAIAFVLGGSAHLLPGWPGHG